MSNATWMADLQKYIAALVLKDFVIFGTNDSGTYGLGYPFAPRCTRAWPISSSNFRLLPAQ